MTQMMKTMTQTLQKKNNQKERTECSLFFYTLDGSNTTFTLFALQVVVTIF